MKAALKQARHYLEATQTASGGWPYSPGNEAAPEPTCYALLASAGAAPSLSALAVERGAQWLSAQTGASGALRADSDGGPHWSISLAVLTWVRLHRHSELLDEGVSALLDWKVRTPRPSATIPLDSRLQGWSWFPNTFSWVEPTSLALIALKAAGFSDHPRVAEGETLLQDRVCTDGGWNYGNSKVYGQELYGYPDTTALALLALQGAPVASSVPAGIEFLQRAAFEAPSTLTFAWTILSLQAHDVDVQRYVEPLLARQLPDGSWRETVHLTALAMLAVQAASGGPNAFRL